MVDSSLVTRVDSPTGTPHAASADPVKISRYTILKRLGEGGMGVVYAAYDTELDRKIALKVLRCALRDGDTGTSRSIREAQAMARISHPNVLQVYEVGLHAERIFLALEYVEGKTLREWYTARPRPWREVLDRFLEAGEGLQAAHAAGIVHRDFKPDNVLVDDRGRVRVMDFGLARATQAETKDEAAPPEPGDVWTSGSLELSLTRTGSFVGTPAYMAPEQFLGQAIDARTDVFSFCVALWEGLYGRRPFSGDDMGQLRESVLSGRLREPPRERKLPAWIRRALLRGLSLDPDARFPTMTSLLAALRADPWPRRRRALVAVFSALAMGAGAYGYTAAVESAAAACRGGARWFAEVWDEGRAEMVAAAYATTDRPYAPATAEHVRARLDAYASGWAKMHGDACEAHRRGEQSDELLDRRMACLERRRDQVAALVQVFVAADGEVVDRAIEAVQGLGELDVCGDLAALHGGVEPPESSEQREAVAAVRRRLDAAGAELRAGRVKQALALVEPEVAAAEALGYRPLLAEATLTRAKILAGLARGEEARAELLRSVWAAEASRHDEVAAEAWTLAVRVAGVELGKFDDAAHWYERASAAVARRGDPPQARADLLNARGAVAMHASKFSDALHDFESALQLLRELYDDDDFQLARVYNNIGQALVQLDRLAEGRQWLERTLALRRRHLGEEHPDIAVSYNNLGVVYSEMGESDEAYRSYERALAIWQASLGPDNAIQINALVNLAAIEFARHDLEAAVRSLSRAEALAGRSLAPDSPLASTLRGNLGALHAIRGAYAEAEAIMTAELARLEAAHGSDSPALGDQLLNLASVLTARGEYRRARELLSRDVLESYQSNERARRSVLLVEGALRLGELPAAQAYLRDLEAMLDRPGTEASSVSSPSSRHATLVLAAEVARRTRDLPRAVALVREAPAEPSGELALCATLKFYRAQVLWEANIDRPAARAAAEAALAELRSRPEADPGRSAAIEAWLAAPPK